jgi:hypothetical protein
MKCKRIEYVQGKTQAPLQTMPKGWQTPSSQLKRAANKIQAFSMIKTILPPETKANKNKRQTQPKMPTTPQTKSYQWKWPKLPLK